AIGEGMEINGKKDQTITKKDFKLALFRG
ncbi:hypothetical protein LCGC14_0950450, partial [marine sediment metagenome]